VSGSRHFTLPSSKSRSSNSSSNLDFSSDSDSESEDTDASDDCSGEELSLEVSTDGVRGIPRGVRPYTLDGCIRMWGFGHSDSDGSDKDTCGC
jgi:hypothetical protein